MRYAILSDIHSNLRHPQRFDDLVEAAQMIDTLAVCRTPRGR